MKGKGSAARRGDILRWRIIADTNYRSALIKRHLSINLLNMLGFMLGTLGLTIMVLKTKVV